MSDVLISALDLLTLFLVLLFLALMAVRYDAAKGLGERSYVKVLQFQSKDEPALGKDQSSRFQIVTLDTSALRLSRYEAGREKQIGTFKTVEALFKSGGLDHVLPCVIYERQQSPVFAELIRTLAAKKIRIALAQVAQ